MEKTIKTNGTNIKNAEKPVKDITEEIEDLEEIETEYEETATEESFKTLPKRIMVLDFNMPPILEGRYEYNKESKAKEMIINKVVLTSIDNVKVTFKPYSYVNDSIKHESGFVFNSSMKSAGIKLSDLPEIFTRMLKTIAKNGKCKIQTSVNVFQKTFSDGNTKEYYTLNYKDVNELLIIEWGQNDYNKRLFKFYLFLFF